MAVLSHDAKFDEPAILAALARGCRYVGAIGSRKRLADRRERLLAAGARREDLDRLRSPIGLDLGGRAPAEIALAIMAEIVAMRYGGTGLAMREKTRPKADPPSPAGRPRRLPPPRSPERDRGRPDGRGRAGGRRLVAIRAAPRRWHRCGAGRCSSTCSTWRRRSVSERSSSSSATTPATIERRLRWRDERRVRNPDPDAGLSSSLRVGLESLGPASEAALILLGDQPLVRVEVIERLLAAVRVRRPGR